MELNQLYTRGTKMAEVDPAFKGMPFWKWRLDMLSRQAEQHRSKVTELPPVADAKIVTFRDEYGMKGLRGS